MSVSSDGIAYISSLLKLGQMYRPEDMYLKDFPIKDKNELINYIKYIHQDISLSAETIEHIYSNNFKFNEEQGKLSAWSKNELLYKFGINSSLYQQSQKLYDSLLTNIINEGKEIKNNNNKNINEDMDMKIEEENLTSKEVKNRMSNVNSLCFDFEKAVNQYRDNKKKEEEEKKRIEEEKRRIEEEQNRIEEEKRKIEEEKKMPIENESRNKKKKEIRKKITVDGIEFIAEDEERSIEKLEKYENFF